MLRPGVAHRVDPCDICGAVGYPELIMTCCKCKIAREHVNETISPKYGGNKNLSSSQACFRRKIPVATGKVKFIPEEEVIKLSRGQFALKSGPANSFTCLARKTSVGSKNAIPKNSTLAVKPNPSIRPTDGNIPTDNRVEKSLMANQQAPHSIHKVVSASERKAPNTPAKEYDCREQSPRFVRPINKPESCLPVVSSGGAFHDVDEFIRSNVEERDLQSLLTKFKLYLSYLPSLDVSWRGGFKFNCAAASGEFYGAFQAQPPCTIHRKAYKSSLQMPPILEVEPICTSLLLTDLFQNDCPDLQDVALYFFPSDNTERSRQSLNSVFELLNVNNSTLKCAINGVELLMFTSKQLDVDSQGIIARVTAEYFLWGVFRQVKYDKIAKRSSDMEVVSMEIDMLGGIDVGITDLVMQDKPKNVSIGSREGAILEDNFASPTELRKQMKTVADFRSPTREYSRTMDKLDVPPGFEAKRR
ncbi:hypothetical protein L6164_011240 [Bauhinia variegata]|uniref:Uncharacterized protein n=1 Tax=Bauhinia variegata TaxID=167791 RepID=A0ACB9P668_BAUVA|nr:hypothetical protein L6164_011240 [Bauhinia variegata]